MKLSICMMVKDEEQNLVRCLESLRPLRNQLESELIIVDTGSTDSTVALAQTYTGRIYFHPWNNNFSEMRNITISYATGEWIMIMDADEELTDIADILYFFNRKDLQASFGACTFNVINTLSSNKDDEAVFASARLFKNDGIFHYEGIVHNQAKWQGKTLKFNTIINHYGYDSTDKDLMEKKFQRTAKLLLEELSQNPNNIYIRYQLAVSYAMHKDLEKGLVEIRKAYTTIFEQNLDPWTTIYVYGRYASLALASKQFEEVEKICLEGIKIEPEYIDLYYILARLYELQGRYKVAIKYFEEYLDLLNKFDSLTLSRNYTIQFYYMGKFNDAKLKLGELYVKVKDYSASLQIITQLIGKASDLPSWMVEQAIDVYIDAALTSQKFKKLMDLYCQLSEPELRNYFLKKLEISKQTLSEDEQTVIITIFAQGEESYASLNQIRIAFQEKSLAEKEQLIQDLANILDFDSEPEFYADLLFFLIFLNQPLADILRKISKEKSDLLIAYLYKTRESVQSLVINYVLTMSDLENFSQLRLSRLLLKNTLLYGELADGDYKRLLKMYIQVGLKYVKLLYNEVSLGIDLWPALDKEDRFLLQLAQADEEKVKGNYHNAVKILRASLKTSPEFNQGIDIITKELRVCTDSAAKEFQQYSRQVKVTIENLINNEELDSAASLLTELGWIIGEDSELVSMKAVVLMKKGELNEAEKLLRSALGSDSENFDLLYNLAYTYELEQKISKALGYYKKARRHCPDQTLGAAIEEHLADLKKNLL